MQRKDIKSSTKTKILRGFRRKLKVKKVTWGVVYIILICLRKH